MGTQVRLLRVLESGEFIRVGSSKVQKTNVRVIAASNIDINTAIQTGNFREDLYYRLNTVPIIIPLLKDRHDDIHLLFRKFASDFAEKNRMPPIVLSDEARAILITYEWPGNIRQLKNITEQISVIEKTREINADILRNYLPDYQDMKLPALFGGVVDHKTFANEREILYKILFDMKNDTSDLKNDITDLKKLVLEIMQKGVDTTDIKENNANLINKLYRNIESDQADIQPDTIKIKQTDDPNIQDTEEIIEESLSLEDKEIELIKKALEKHKGKRKYAALELGISERTLYRKIKEYNIE